jgi:hypothetical protein
VCCATACYLLAGIFIYFFDLWLNVSLINSITFMPIINILGYHMQLIRTSIAASNMAKKPPFLEVQTSIW